MTAPSPEFAPGGIVPGTRYRITSEIGRGGMGSVFEVEHVELGKRFVLKAVLDGMFKTAELVRRLRDEWRALGRLEHPNIISVTDAGTTPGGVPYYVMERLYGEDLAVRLRRGKLTLRDAVRIGCEVLEALDAAHQIGVIHRDVKPSNVFLTQQGNTKLLDFGVAKLLDREVALTKIGTAVGTPRYMSPEQAAGEGVDSRSDLYAVGLLLFEMIAGQSPFEDCEERGLFDGHLRRTSPRLVQLVPEVPEELDRLVARLLEKSPAERPSSAGSAAALLRAMRSTYGSIPPAEAVAPGVAQRMSSPSLEQARNLVTRAAAPIVLAGEAETVPSPFADALGSGDASTTPTELLSQAEREAETRTSVTTETSPAVSSSAAREGVASHAARHGRTSPGRSPSWMLVAGLVGGAAAASFVGWAVRGGGARSGAAEPVASAQGSGAGLAQPPGPGQSPIPPTVPAALASSAPSGAARPPEPAQPPEVAPVRPTAAAASAARADGVRPPVTGKKASVPRPPAPRAPVAEPASSAPRRRLPSSGI